MFGSVFGGFFLLKNSYVDILPCYTWLGGLCLNNQYSKKPHEKTSGLRTLGLKFGQKTLYIFSLERGGWGWGGGGGAAGGAF